MRRVLGPGWPSLHYSELQDRAQQHEQAASFARTLAHYMVDTETDTAGEALERLQAATAYRPGESLSSA
jgi:hypothetical protein